MAAVAEIGKACIAAGGLNTLGCQPGQRKEDLYSLSMHMELVQWPRSSRLLQFKRIMKRLWKR